VSGTPARTLKLALAVELIFFVRQFCIAICFMVILGAAHLRCFHEHELVLYQGMPRWMMTSLLSDRPQPPLQHLGQAARGCVPSALDALADSSATDFNDLAGDFVIFSQDDKTRHDGLEAGARSAALPRLYQRPGQPCFIALRTGSVRTPWHRRISDNSL
jgi:hypothetical protein